jgi:hypothetical protein
MTMRRSFAIFFLVAAHSVGASESSRGPFCSGPPSGDVELHLSVAPEASSPLDPTLTLVFVNTSGHPIALATPLTFGHALFLSITGNGIQVPLSGSLVANVPGRHLILKPGARHKITRHLRRIENFTVPALEPGPHMISVCYRNPHSSSASSAPERTSWPELLVSAEASFVTP